MHWPCYSADNPNTFTKENRKPSESSLKVPRHYLHVAVAPAGMSTASFAQDPKLRNVLLTDTTVNPRLVLQGYGDAGRGLE
jgi:glucose/arabinose dehydrogenase